MLTESLRSPNTHVSPVREYSHRAGTPVPWHSRFLFPGFLQWFSCGHPEGCRYL